MDRIHYRVVKHDGGWAYRLGDVFSEPFPTREAALQRAREVAQQQHVAGDEGAMIEYQDAQGEWHTEYAAPEDRPEADVVG